MSQHDPFYSENFRFGHYPSSYNHFYPEPIYPRATGDLKRTFLSNKMAKKYERAYCHQAAKLSKKDIPATSDLAKDLKITAKSGSDETGTTRTINLATPNAITDTKAEISTKLEVDRLNLQIENEKSRTALWKKEAENWKKEFETVEKSTPRNDKDSYKKLAESQLIQAIEFYHTTKRSYEKIMGHCIPDHVIRVGANTVSLGMNHRIFPDDIDDYVSRKFDQIPIFNQDLSKKSVMQKSKNGREFLRNRDGWVEDRYSCKVNLRSDYQKFREEFESKNKDLQHKLYMTEKEKQLQNDTVKGLNFQNEKLKSKLKNFEKQEGELKKLRAENKKILDENLALKNKISSMENAKFSRKRRRNSSDSCSLSSDG